MQQHTGNNFCLLIRRGKHLWPLGQIVHEQYYIVVVQVFDEWITPMRNQLSRMEMTIKNLGIMFACMHTSLTYGAKCIKLCGFMLPYFHNCLIVTSTSPFSSGYASHNISPDAPNYPHGYFRGHSWGHYSDTSSIRPFDLTFPITSSDPSLLPHTSGSTPKSPANHQLHVSSDHPSPSSTATSKTPGSAGHAPPPSSTATFKPPSNAGHPQLPSSTATSKPPGNLFSLTNFYEQVIVFFPL